MEVEVRKDRLNASRDVRLEMCPQKMKLKILRTGGVLENGKNSGHCASEIVSIKSHGDMDFLGTTGVTIAKSRGFTEVGEMGLGRRFANNAAANTSGRGGGGGGGAAAEGVEEEEKEANSDKEREGRGGHPALALNGRGLRKQVKGWLTKVRIKISSSHC